MKESIGEFFKKHLSDKNLNGYSPIYDTIFEPYKNDKINLLEIGIGTLKNTNSNMLFWKDKYQNYQPGASLRAFKDYFPNGEIYGIDIQDDCMIKEDRIHTFLVDSTNKTMVDHYFDGVVFDYIIDDGDHHWESQVKTFVNLIDKLKRGGVYFIEDLAYPDDIKKYFDDMLDISGCPYHYEIANGILLVYKVLDDWIAF